jgi:hypothetical protein
MDGGFTIRRLRYALAGVLVFALTNVISVCPVLAHQVPASQSCCEHSHGQNLPCTDTTPNNCPYVLLEKSLAKIGLPAWDLGAEPSGRVEAIHTIVWFSSRTLGGRGADVSDSYLLFRVLLI